MTYLEYNVFKCDIVLFYGSTLCGLLYFCYHWTSVTQQKLYKNKFRRGLIESKQRYMLIVLKDTNFTPSTFD